MLKLVIIWLVFQTHVTRALINARSDELIVLNYGALFARNVYPVRQNLS